MVFNRFFFKTLIRVMFLVASLSGIAFLFPRTDLFFTQIILIIIAIIQVVELTVFVNRTNYDLARFISSLKDGDFTISFSQTDRTKSFRALHSSFNDLAMLYKGMETDLATQYHFLQKLVDQIEFGILVFGEESEIILANKEALSMLQVPEITHWHNLKTSSATTLKKLSELEDTKNQLLELELDDQFHSLSVSVVSVYLQEEVYRFCSFQDIKNEIQRKEMEAWQRMTRVLTHEVMNSVTPLASLSDTLMLILSEQSSEILESDQLSDVKEAVSTINSRTKGMLRFVEDFRRLARVPKPVLELVDLEDVVSSVLLLSKVQFEKYGIHIVNEVPSVKISLDRSLIEQVLINLLKNAQDALNAVESRKEIKIEVSPSDEFLMLGISDNGCGIPREKLDRIFVPFYTTKPEGSGVGLSLSRQIMFQHGGSIDVSTTNDQGTTFLLRFPNKLLS